jgi:hypothetical protein
MNVPVITCPPGSLSFDQLCDLVDVQQRTISFLINEYNDMLAMVEGQGGTFGQPVSVASGAVVGAGWWQSITPTTGVIAHIPTVGTGAGAATNVPINAGLFWSDGTLTAAAAVSLTAVAQPVAPAA